MISNFSQKWLRIALINLNIVAFLGIILRYKIAFSFPFVDQKHLLHSHSHFAFNGWISQALIVLMIEYLFKSGLKNVYQKYKWVIITNLITAYGMLISFAIQGYGVFSIIFSTSSIILSFIFGIIYWKDLNRLISGIEAQRWLKAAIIFNMVSSLGAFGLSVMMINHVVQEKWYLASVYFFLHFQYNGWFFFALMGLIVGFLFNDVVEKKLLLVFRLFVFACPAAYFLSALWLPIPVWIYIVVIISAIVQCLGWIFFLKILLKYRNISKEKVSMPSRRILIIAAFALSIKLVLQLGSVYPPLSKLAFGYRPIVIGYLHLVLLGVISLGILGYLFATKLVRTNNTSYAGIAIFMFGLFLNELFLMLQGGSAIFNKSMPYSNENLIIAALTMFFGLVVLNVGQFKDRSSLKK